MSLLNFNSRRYLLFMNDFALLQSLEDTPEDTWRYLKILEDTWRLVHRCFRPLILLHRIRQSDHSRQSPVELLLVHLTDFLAAMYPTHGPRITGNRMRYLWDHMRKGRTPSVSWDSRARHQHVMHCATHCLTNSGLLDLFHHLTASIHWASYRSDHIRSYQIILSSRSRCHTSVTLKRASGRGLRHAASVFALSWQESMKIMK